MNSRIKLTLDVPVWLAETLFYDIESDLDDPCETCTEAEKYGVSYDECVKEMERLYREIELALCEHARKTKRPWSQCEHCESRVSCFVTEEKLRDAVNGAVKVLASKLKELGINKIRIVEIPDIGNYSIDEPESLSNEVENMIRALFSLIDERYKVDEVEDDEGIITKYVVDGIEIVEVTTY
ncbi:MAG: hypothetical protein DRJ47_06785 [Thermoprotei archaeon]|nr:MAG: hypothetical protein DRJ47_06785 [Thermoprotei archaeon]